MHRKSLVRTPKWIWLVLLSLLLIVSAVSVHAWQGDGGELIIGQPAFGNIAAGTSLTYTYNLSDSRAVTLQVIGEVVQPTITILKAGQPVASQPNVEGSKIVSLTALLDAGGYTIQVGSVNNTVGSVIVVVQSAEPITTGQLPIASVVIGQVKADVTTATYNFTALPEPAFLYFESTMPTGGATLHLKNTATGNESVINGADVSGARFRIPAGNTAYDINVAFTGSDQPQTFTLCLTLVSASSCEAGSAPQTITSDIPAPTPDASNPSVCTVTPLNANGANIRKTADTASPVIIGLPNGEIASVTGVSPAGNFFKVNYHNVNGWVAQVEVGSSGDLQGCTRNHPACFRPDTHPHADPTDKSARAYRAVPHHHQSDKLLIYTRPDDKPDYIFDQVQKGYQLVPTGRLKNNSWWQTNYNGAWIQTKFFGHEARVSGNCNHLPVVNP